MSTNDYVKYVTQQLVSYIDKPKELRKQMKEDKKIERDPFVSKWFGIFPFAIMMLFKKQKKH